ncbi:MAG: DinB family protein [Gemmatimonadetes bacterium]|nr:DinB family protein [Gemmatimonadota bacterium]
MKAEIAKILQRDLAAIRREIEAYPSEADLWKSPPGITNPGGTMALHVAGNLRHFFGAVLAKDGFVRDRSAEFAARDVPRADIVARLDAAAAAVTRALDSLPESRLDEPYPVDFDGLSLSVRQFVLHLAVHLAYHLGQIDYHRRLVTGDARTVGAASIPELGDRA